MGKRLLLAILAVLLGAAPASAAYFDMQAGAFNASFRYVATSSLTTSDYLVAPARGFNRMAFTKGSAFAATVYACETNTYVAASCTSVTTLSASDTDIEVKTGRPWFVIDVTTAETGSNVSYITIKSNPQEASGGGGGSVTADADGDGLYESAMLWDADGDGSTEVVCTAKDAPDPACKADGEIIYRDFADDLNCAMHGCSNGQMERNGSIYLRDAVAYVIWPCWEPTNARNPSTAGTEASHDTTGDSAWGDCPASPDPISTRRLGTIATLGWQGEIIGGGFDTRNPKNTTTYLRNKGTYIVNDMGPAWKSGAQSGGNSWWGTAGFVRPFNLGFSGTHTSDQAQFVEAGEDAGDFDSKGYGTASGTQTIEATNGYLCVTEANMGTPVNGDRVIVYGASQIDAGTSPTVAALMRVLAWSTTDCNGAGTAKFTLGGVEGGAFASLTEVRGASADVPHAYSIIDGASVVMARSDILDPAVRISNVTFTSQDAWNDSSGDCSATGFWDASTDGASADFDCDTNPLIAMFGGGHSVIEDVVFSGWHDYAIDGDSNIGNPLIRRAQFLYGKGGPIIDAGSGWNVRDIEVRETQFANNGISIYGPGLHFDGMKIYGSAGTYFMTLGSQAINDTFENIEFDSSAFTNHFNFQCGARYNLIRNVQLSNVKGFGNSYTNGLFALFTCTNTTYPIQLNSIENVNITGAGFADDDLAAGYSPDQNVAAVVFDTNAVKGTSNASAIIRNRFEGFNYRFSESSANFEACMFGMIDRAASTRVGVGVDFDQEQVFANNVFYGNTIFNSGSGADLMYCNCGLQDGSAPTGGFKSCGDSILGTAADGVNARGCMNTDKDVTVSSSIQTCN